MAGVLILLAMLAYLNHADDTSRLTVMYPNAPQLQPVDPSDYPPQQVNRFGFTFSGVR